MFIRDLNQEIPNSASEVRKPHSVFKEVYK